MHSPLTKQKSVICDLDGARAALWSQVLEEHQKQADEFLFMGDPVNGVQTNNSIYLSMQKKIKFNSKQPGKKMTEIENMDVEDSIVCPYCFHEHKGPLLNFRVPTPWECERCYYFFTVDASVSVKFSTNKSDCLNREGPHVFGDWVTVTRGGLKKERQCRDCGVKEYESE